MAGSGSESEGALSHAGVDHSVVQEACELGIRLLEEGGHDIPSVLYLTYMAYRERFIAERELMNSPPGEKSWQEALTDARAIEWAVNHVWTETLLGAFRPSSSADQSSTGDPAEVQ